MSTIKFWFKSAGIRSLKTFAQCLAGIMSTAVIGSAVDPEQLIKIDWKIGILSALFASVYSILMSVVGLPEVELKEEVEHKEAETVYVSENSNMTYDPNSQNGM